MGGQGGWNPNQNLLFQAPILLQNRPPSALLPLYSPPPAPGPAQQHPWCPLCMSLSRGFFPDHDFFFLAGCCHPPDSKAELGCPKIWRGGAAFPHSQEHLCFGKGTWPKGFGKGRCPPQAP